MDRRKYPRYPDKEAIGIFPLEEKKLIGEATLRNVGVKGCSFEMETPPLEVDQKVLIQFGFKRGKRVEVPAEIVAKYMKEGHQSYSARFSETDMLKLNIIREYIEEIRIGKI
jgi:hypothetical protein